MQPQEGGWFAAELAVDTGTDYKFSLDSCDPLPDPGWGYDSVDLFAPHHEYGGSDDLKRFIDACHTRGLAVVMDVVYNHLGPSGNYLELFGPYFTARYGTPWGKAINFDGTTRRRILEATRCVRRGACGLVQPKFSADEHHGKFF